MSDLEQQLAYRAAGFVLTGIKKNDQIWAAPDAGARFSRTSLTDNRSKSQQSAARRLSRVTATKANNIMETGAASMRPFIEAGFKPLQGFQLRYIYFIDPAYRQRLTVPELPYSAIADAGARMYKGERLDTRPVNGDDLATSEAGRFDSEPGAQGLDR